MVAGARVHRRYVRVQIIALSRLTRNRMAVHATRMLNHLGGFGEQSNRTRTLVADAREGRDGLERNIARRIRSRSQSDKRSCRTDSDRRPAVRFHADVRSCCGSIGSVRMRLPVAAKIAWGT